MLYIIFLLIAATSDSDIYMLEKGATLNKLDFKHILFHCLIFSVVEAIMLLLGLNFGFFITNQIIRIFHEVITVIAMLCISAILFVKTYKRKNFVEHRSNGFELRTSLKQAFFTGIDTFLIGIGISSFGYSFELICFVGFILNFISSLIIICFGYYVGTKFQKIFGYANAFVYFILANIELIMIFI